MSVKVTGSFTCATRIEQGGQGVEICFLRHIWYA
jgi:hypothetical protein